MIDIIRNTKQIIDESDGVDDDDNEEQFCGRNTTSMDINTYIDTDIDKERNH